MKPITRLEHFLAKIAGDKNAKNLNPITRKEYYLNEIAEASQPFVVTFSGTTTGGDAACDKTFEEIDAAYNLGKKIEAVWLAPEAENFLLRGSLVQITDLNNDSMMFTFFCGYYHPDYGIYAVCNIGAESVNVDYIEV